MRRLWPDPDPGDLDDAALHDLYAPPDRSTPRLRMNFVTSTDGAVTVDGHSAGLSNPPDQRVFGLLREVCDALMVGAGTLRNEGYGAITLDAGRRERRVAQGLPPVPPLVIVSGTLGLSADHPMFARAPVRPVLLTHAASPAAVRSALERVADVLVHGEESVDLTAGLADLAERGLTQVLCEGGPLLFGTLTEADLVDELCLTVSPLLAGAGPDRIVSGPPSPQPRSLRLGHLLEEDGTLLLRYLRADPPSDPSSDPH